MPLAKRLFVAFLLCGLVGVICWVVLPRYGVYVPPTVVFLGYFVILGASILAAAPGGEETDEKDGQSSTDDEPPIAGRIGPRPDDANENPQARDLSE